MSQQRASRIVQSECNDRLLGIKNRYMAGVMSLSDAHKVLKQTICECMEPEIHALGPGRILRASKMALEYLEPDLDL